MRPASRTYVTNATLRNLSRRTVGVGGSIDASVFADALVLPSGLAVDTVPAAVAVAAVPADGSVDARKFAAVNRNDRREGGWQRLPATTDGRKQAGEEGIGDPTRS